MAPTDAPVAVPGSGRVALATMRLDALVAAPYNPRSITEPALGGLSESVRRFGLVQPVIWNRRTGHVVGGHQRLKALAAQGVVETDVVVVDLPELEEKALNLALNSPAISGQFTADLEGAGIKVVPYGQGFVSMNAPTKHLDVLVRSGNLRHARHPVLRWMAGNVMLEKDAADNWKPSKRRSKEKIDGIVALIMALGRAVVAKPDVPITPMVFHITGDPDDGWGS